jgi:pSer/pThr/pTyr-binding forkhead associated (FHA) protein
MKIILKAKSKAMIQDILIEEFPFTIGRDKSPFVELKEQSGEMKKAVSFLSRNHAVISSEQDQIYIADMGSVNGTTRNGFPVGKEPVKLCNGDSLGLGEQLEYTFLIEGDDSDKTFCASESSISLTLIPEDANSGLDDIVIQDFPFLISRTEGYFSQYNDKFPEEVKKLSRKHARLFYKDNKLYVEDFGSVNGTTLAEKKVGKQAMSLCSGDHIAFGQFFRYRLNSDAAGNESTDDQTVCDRTAIDSVPQGAEKSDAGGDPTVSEKGGKTADYGADAVKNEEKSSPEKVKNSDLPSRESDEKREPVVNEKGSDHGADDVKSEEKNSPEKVKDGGIPSRESDEKKEPTVKKREKTAACDVADVKKEEKNSPKKVKDGKISPQGKTITFAKDPTLFSEAVLKKRDATGSKSDDSKNAADTTRTVFKKIAVKWVLAGLGAFLFIACAVWMATEISPEYKLRKLLTEKNYKECISSANEILSQHSKAEGWRSVLEGIIVNKEKVREIATEAILKDILPAWTAKLSKALFSEAREILMNTDEYIKDNPDAQKSLTLLRWIVDMEEYFSGRNFETPVIIFRDEIRIASLLEKWNTNKNENLLLLNQITKHDNAFESFEKRISSNLLTLQKWKSDYFTPVQDFKDTIQQKLNAGRLQELDVAINKFKREFPGVGGIDKIEDDLSKYKSLLQANQPERVKQAQFKTKPFIDKAAGLLQ